ncbi:MAG: glycosyltransferase family 2 protein [Bacteroidota bacterium]|nr:glycosyltransferase family 2 protein [Bacteroidota bacterium]
MEKIGVVTITYNSEDVLQCFLKDLIEQRYQNFILYIIDNGSTDNTRSILNNISDKRIKISINRNNLGVAQANNQGIKKALNDGCDQILIMNNDVEFEPHLIDKLLSVQKKKNASLVAPKIMYYANPDIIWYAGSKFNKWKGFLPIHTGIDTIDNGYYDSICKVEYAPTCCLLIKKKVFEDVGFMDEKYFVYFDDTDFCYRILHHKDHDIYYAPNIKFYHKVGSLTKSFVKMNKKVYRGNFFIQQTVRNHIYFLKKIGGLYSIIYIFFLFFINNIRFLVNPKIKKNFSTFLLINQSYFKGIFL